VKAAFLHNLTDASTSWAVFGLCGPEISSDGSLHCSIQIVCYNAFMSFENPEQIDGALQRLGSRLLYEYTAPISLVICGGSALNILNIAQRTTRDVDVLAVVEESESGIVLRPDMSLPDDFRKVVAWVAQDLQLEEDWLNMGPKDVLTVYGAPEGMTQRWVKRDYGPSLTAFFVSRLDQIHFKLLAAMDPKSRTRHMEDLTERIKPTENEIRTAVGWLLNRKTSPQFRERIRNSVEAIGYETICHDI
jgi:hypothetical protein